MAALIRTGQWRVTPLGAIETWPQALKTTVEIMLQSRQPAYVCWGRALTTLYNDAAIAVLGNRHPRALGRPYPEVVPEAWDDLKPVIEAAFDGEAQHLVGQRTARGGDQPVTWSTFTWTPLRDDKGKVAGLYCVATETSLQIGDEQLRTVLENARDAVSMLDLAAGKYVFISPSHTALTGFTAEEMKEFTPADFFSRLHPDDVERVRHPVHEEDDGFEGAVEYRWKVKSGEYRWFAVSRKLVHDGSGRPVALVSINRDITERKRAELEVLASRATLAAALESMTDAVYITDAEGRFLQANTTFANFHRYACPDKHASNFDDFAKDFDAFFPDGRPAAPENRPVPRALRGETAVAAEYRLVRKDTGASWIGSYSFGPIRDQNGTITGAVVTARDITEAREAAEALRRSETRLALATESADMGTWEWDIKTDTVIRSPKIYELLGIDPLAGADEASTFWSKVDPDDLKRVLDGLEELKESGSDWRDEFRVYRPDGSVRWLVGVGRLVRDPDGSPMTMYGVNYDITEQKTAEAELRQSEARTQSLKEQLMHVGRVSELSQVSAGIAHELNQPLAAMLNYSATAKRLIAKNDQATFEAAAKAITQAGAQALRAAEIIRRMRDFVEKRDTRRMPDDINAIVQEAAELGLIGAKADGIDTVFDLESDLPPVTTDRVQIEQVLINLMHNAMDAMGESAVRHLTLTTRRKGPTVEVSVSDTGHGIPDHLAEMLFQPFVTTKKAGMGIGLAISRSIIEAHGGEITAASRDGRTVFRFSLPL
jgi:PAS domain S-box-containing protein